MARGDWVYEVSIPSRLSNEFVDWIVQHDLLDDLVVIREGK